MKLSSIIVADMEKKFQSNQRRQEEIATEIELALRLIRSLNKESSSLQEEATEIQDILSRLSGPSPVIGQPDTGGSKGLMVKPSETTRARILNVFGEHNYEELHRTVIMEALHPARSGSSVCATLSASEAFSKGSKLGMWKVSRKWLRNP